MNSGWRAPVASRTRLEVSSLFLPYHLARELKRCMPFCPGDSIPRRTATFAAEWVVEGRVVALSDGDTITVLDSAKAQRKVRLAGIDAPEKAQVFWGAVQAESLAARLRQGRSRRLL